MASLSRKKEDGMEKAKDNIIRENNKTEPRNAMRTNLRQKLKEGNLKSARKPSRLLGKRSQISSLGLGFGKF